MKTVKIIILSLASVSFGLTSLGAQAACSTADIAGTWRVFSVTGSLNKNFQGVGRGTLVFGKNGALNIKSSSFILSNGSTIKFTKGQATVNPACKVTGIAEARVGPTTVIKLNVFDAKMNSSKNVGIGVYRLSVPGIGTDIGLTNLIK